MATVDKSFTATGSGAQLRLRHGDLLSYDLLGTFVATVRLEYSRDATNWTTYVSSTTATSGSFYVELPDRGKANFRWTCSAFTSGTAVTRMFSNNETNRVGTKNGSTVTAQELGGDGLLRRTILNCVETPIAMADDAGVAQYGGVLVYTFPEGVINVLGATIKGNFKGYASLIDTFDGDVALGTVTATTGATLVSTEATILQSTAITQAVGETAAVAAFPVATQVTECGARWIDGTTTPVPCFLNFVVDDDAAHGAGTATFTGQIVLTWVNLGDY